MAYAPGVQDMRGQLWGQGIQQFAQGIDALARRREQNNVFLSKAKATEGFIKNNPEKFGGEEAVKQFLDVNPRESPEARFARLQGAMENTILQTKLQEAQQQAQMRQLEIQRAQQQQAQLDKLRQFSQVARGVGSGVYRPQVQDGMRQQMQQNPYLAQAAQVAQATGQVPAPETMLQIQAQKEAAAAKPRETVSYETAPSGERFARLGNTLTKLGAEKPTPGSKGYAATEVPGVGKIITDSATGEPVSSSNIVKDEKAPKKTEAEVTFETNLDVAMKKLSELSDVVERSGTYETRFGNQQDAAALDQLPYQLAVLTAKIVDPASVAREGEVAVAQKYLLPTGMFASKAKTLAAIENLKKTFEQYSKARSDAQGQQQAPARGDAPLQIKSIKVIR